MSKSLLAICRIGALIKRSFKSKVQTVGFANPASIMSTSSSASVKRYEIIKSPEDDREYRGLILLNELKVVLVSDPSSDKAAAALDVHVGSMSDPKQLPGLAHFLEHMLFLGTKKYPDENEYSKFLSHHGGWSNAYTAGDHTNYYFDVSPKFLPGALDRFAQFFLEPLFTEGATEREVMAVNSEHEKNIPSDSWRLNQIEHALSDPEHDYFKFGTGNIETLQDKPKALGIDVRQELLNFHQRWYSSNIMSLAVVGNQSLDELEAMATELFSGVENKDVSVTSYMTHPYTAENSKSITYIVPVKDLRFLYITFPIPDLDPYYKSSPGDYLAHLIGHEGKGSLLSELKNLRWANSLVGGQKEGSKGFGFFVVNIDLTETGLEHIDEIILLVFQYLQMLRTKDGIQEWIFEECKNINAMQFRFKDKEKPTDLASKLAAKAHDYPIEEVLTGSSILTDWRPDLVKMVLDNLVPENVFVTVVAQKFADEATSIEPWYGTKYKTEKITSEKIAKWTSAGLNEKLQIPERNDFIPTSFDLAPRDLDDSEFGPTILKETPLLRLWFKQDNEFKRPKACLNFQFKSPVAYIDPHHANVTYMFSQLIKDELNEFAYAASLAGLNYNINNSKYGFSLAISGYNQKLATLLEKIVNHVSNFSPNEERFEVLKEQYVRWLKNFRMEQPHQHAVYFNQMFLSTLFWSKQDMISVIDYLTFEAVRGFVDQLDSFGIFIEVLVHGNLTPDDALNVSGILEKSFSNSRTLLKSQLIRDREIQLSPNSNYYHTVTTDVHKSSCIEVCIQCGVEDSRSNVLLELFEQIIHESCFDVLRTKEQLGYIVYSGVNRPRGVQSLRIIVQSNKKPDYLDQRIENFLWSMRKHIEDLSDEEFEKNKASLSDRISEKPKKLSSRNAKFWSEIASQQYNFNRDEAEVAEIKSISKLEILDFYDTFISAKSLQRRKIAAHVISTVEEPDLEAPKLDAEEIDVEPSNKPVLVDDVVAFKAAHPIWPLAKSYKKLEELTRK